MKIYENILETIGNTPLVKVNKMNEAGQATVLLKMEYFNPGSSAKDRIGIAMIEAAEKSGALAPGGTIVEPTSGNTGIGLAIAAAVRGYRMVLTMPDTMSVERQKLAKALGAEVVLTPGANGMAGAIAKAQEICASTPNSFMPLQFDNAANSLAHYENTGPEIWRDTEGKVDVFVASVGTGGTITGTGRFLKEKNSAIEIVAVEPADSPVISGGKPGLHKLQGIGAGFIPKVLDVSILDKVMTVTTEEAGTAARSIAAKEGLLVGISSGATLHAALKLAASPEYAGKTIVALMPDCGERYLSTWLWE